MSQKKVKLKSKLYISFATVLVLAVIAISYSLINIFNFGNSANKLSNEFIPLTKAGNGFTSAAQKVIIARNNYSVTLQKNYLEEGQKNIDSMRLYLETAKKLVQSFASLSEFQTYINESENSFNSYLKGFNETASSLEKIGEAKIKVDGLRQNFVEASANYLLLQNQLLNSEVKQGAGVNRINERFYRIIGISNVTSKANEAFNLFYTANITRSVETIDLAINNLLEVENKLDELQKRSKNNKENIIISSVINSVSGSKTIMTDNKNDIQKVQLSNSTNKTDDLQLIQGFQKIQLLSINKTELSSKNTANTAQQALMLLFICLVVTIISTLIIAYRVTNNITRNLNKGLHFAHQIAKGNLNATIEIDNKDDIGLLTVALYNMAQKLKAIIVELTESAQIISEAGIIINTNAQTMSKGANSQAAAAQQVSSSMEQMVANIHQNTQNSKQTELISKEAAIGVKNGSETTLTAVDSMKQIANKISIINDIAFQTNILALNAAVEAARAGEHGRGFAVVAAEVRKLAERSKIAAEDIDQLSKSGVQVSETAGQQLKAIVPDIEKTAQLIKNISLASIEQNTGADQINNALQQLNIITQQNAATTDIVATSSEKLKFQSDKLLNLLSFFKFNTDKKQNQQKPLFEQKNSNQPNSVKQVNAPLHNYLNQQKSNTSADLNNYNSVTTSNKITTQQLQTYKSNINLNSQPVINSKLKNIEPIAKTNITIIPQPISNNKNIQGNPLLINKSINKPVETIVVNTKLVQPLSLNENNKFIAGISKKKHINKGVTIDMNEKIKVPDNGYEKY